MKRIALVLAVGVFLGGLLGCAETPSSSDPGTANLYLSAAFSTDGSASSPGIMVLGKTGGTSAADSLRIDSAVVVFKRIKFESQFDSSDHRGPDYMFGQDDDNDMNVVFMGPFVVRIRDTVDIEFAGQVLPAGIYRAVKFKIHKLIGGELYEDSDDEEVGRVDIAADPELVGSSIVVWGAVKKGDVWEPFEFKTGLEAEFRIRGDFLVEEATNSVTVALNFDMGAWFTHPETGELLDPTDLSEANVDLIERAIRDSFDCGYGEMHHHRHRHRERSGS